MNGPILFARVGLAIFALIVGMVLTLWSFALPLRAANPLLAYTLAPFDGRAAALAAKSLLSADATPARRMQADALAREALKLDGTAWEAAAALGMNADITNDADSASKAFNFADALSRRSLLVQLWKIEQAVQRNDVSDAVRRYDVALRTSDTAGKILVPTLASALDAEPIRTALVLRLRADPPWGRAFIINLALKAPNPRTALYLFEELDHAHYAILRGSWADMILQLLGKGDSEGAWRAYRRKAVSVARTSSRDRYFARFEDPPLPFDWVPATGMEMTNAIEGDGQRGRFVFGLTPMGQGLLLQQWQVLPEGRYRLSGVSEGIAGSDADRPYFSLSCHNGPELGRLVLPPSTTAEGAFVGEFTVRDCKMQLLALIAPPSRVENGREGSLLAASLDPLK